MGSRYDIVKNIKDVPEIEDLRKKQAAFEAAGLTEKATQCSIDIRILFAKKSLKAISLKDAYRELFGKNLDMTEINNDRLEAIKLGALIAKPYTGQILTQSQLWKAIQDNSYRVVHNEPAYLEFLQRLLPCARKGSAQELLRSIITGLKFNQDPKNKLSIRIEEWASTTASIELPSDIITAVKGHEKSKLFDKILTACGVTKKEQCTNTLVLGLISNTQIDLPMSISIEEANNFSLGYAMFKLATLKKCGTLQRQANVKA
jgi:hypothetical protein